MQLAVSLHDVAPATWPACQRVMAAVAEVAAIPLTLLVVPAYHGRCSALDRDFVAALNARRAAGDELALHGYFHRDAGTPGDAVDWLRRRVYTAGEGEFSALDEAEAAGRLLLGERWFAAQGWPLAGFVPPAWLLGPGAWRALRAARTLRYVTTLRHVHDLRSGRHFAAPCIALSTRSAPRRVAAAAWLAVAPAVLARAPLLRLALHPADADHARLRRGWQRALEGLLRVRRAQTKAAIVEELARDHERPIPANLAASVAASTRTRGSFASRP